MRWSGIARPTWMSGEVTSMPELDPQRAGRASASPRGRPAAAGRRGCGRGPRCRARAAESTPRLERRATPYRARPRCGSPSGAASRRARRGEARAPCAHPPPRPPRGPRAAARPDEDRPRTEGERDGDIGAAPDAPVHEHLDAITDRVDDRCERVDRRPVRSRAAVHRDSRPRCRLPRARPPARRPRDREPP